MIFYKGSFINYNNPKFLAEGTEQEVEKAQKFLRFCMEKIMEYRNG